MTKLENTLLTLQDINERLQALKAEADAAVAELPSHLRHRAEAYQVTNFGRSSNPYDQTFDKLVAEVEEEVATAEAEQGD